VALQIHSSNGPMTSYLSLCWVTDKQARSSSDGHLDYGMTIQFSSSNGPTTSRHLLLLSVAARGPDHSSDGRKMPFAHCYYEYQAFTSLRILGSEVSRVIF
jgi:hypothetical protein